MFSATLVLVVVINAVRAEPVLSSTALVSFPLAAVALALLFAYAKRRAAR